MVNIRTAEIEFTEDIYGSDGEVRWNTGDHAYVDKRSARELCDVRKAARRVAEGPTLSTNKKVPRRKKEPEPATPAEEEPEAEEGSPDDPEGSD